MPESNSKDLDSLLDVSSVTGKDFSTRLNHFEEKAELLGFKKIEIESYNTKIANPHISNLNLGVSTKKSIFGIYFFHLTGKKTINQENWANFRLNKKISPWNDKVINAENILYIGQRHEYLETRLKNHTVNCSTGTQSLKLFEPNCPSFSYSVTVYYQSKNKGSKAISKIYCLLLETIAKELFPTLIGK